MLDIKPYRNVNLGCGEMVFATYLHWKKIPFELMFEHSWGKEFLYRDVHVTESALKKYYGMNIVWKTMKDDDANVGDSLVDKHMPVAMTINLKDALWLTGAYTTTIPLHCVLLIGKNGKNSYQCLDPTFLDSNFEFCYKAKSHVEFSELEGGGIQLTKAQILKELADNTEKLSCSQLNTKILDYGSYLTDMIQSENNYNIDMDLRSNYHLYTLNRIYRDLLNYRDMIVYIGNILHIDFKEVVTEIGNSAKRWEIIRNLVTKYYYTYQKSFIDEIEKGIQLISKQEILVCRNLYKYTNKIKIN